MSGITKGPWRLEFCECCDYPQISSEVDKSDVVNMHTRMADPISMADAALISMAPELLDILEIIVANSTPQPDFSMGGATDVYAVPMDDIEKAKEIICFARAGE